MKKIKGDSSEESSEEPSTSDDILKSQIQVKCEPLEENQLSDAGSIAHCSYMDDGVTEGLFTRETNTMNEQSTDYRVSMEPVMSPTHPSFQVQVEVSRDHLDSRTTIKAESVAHNADQSEGHSNLKQTDPINCQPLKQEPQDDTESFPEVPIQYLVPEVQMPTVYLLDRNDQPITKCFTCKVCEQKFAQPHRLRAHMHKIHKSQFACELCGAKFTCSSHVKIHMRTHTGEKPFSCTLCDGTFSRVSHLNSHMRTHTGEKPFHCTLCDGKFSHSSTLSAHMRTHTGEKPFSCTTCNSKFTQISNLNKHIRTHTGEKPYNCEVCSIKFTDMTSLKRHRRMHTGEKPFSCPSCEVKFRDSSHLNRHIRIHTGEKPFVCLTCEAKFTQSSNLKTHIKTHHPDVLLNPPPDISLTETLPLYVNMDLGEAGSFDFKELQS